MNWLRHWKVGVALSALFLLGAATGSVVTLKVVKRVVEARTNPERLSQSLLQEYQHRLRLTPEQVARIQPLLARASRELKELRTEMSGRTFQVILLSHEDIAAELTVQQREIFSQVNHELRARFRQPGLPGGKNLPSKAGSGSLANPPPRGSLPAEPHEVK